MVRYVKRSVLRNWTRNLKSAPLPLSVKMLKLKSLFSSLTGQTFLNFLTPEMQKSTLNGGKVPNAYTRLDAFVGTVMEELKAQGIAENTLFFSLWLTTAQWCTAHHRDGP